MLFRQIFDPGLAQYAYLIGCQQTGEALIIDPERDVDRYLAIAESEGLRLVASAETHIHADFLSGARELAERHGVTPYLSAEGGEGWEYDWAAEGAYDAVLLRDGDTFEIGRIRIQAVHTPGHTPEHMSFLVTDVGGGATEPIGVASGDFVFVGDLGRPDLLESAVGKAGSREPAARRLFASTRRFLDLDDHLLVWPGHGAGSACGKALGAVPHSTVGYERRFNAALSFDSEDGFVRAILDGQPEPPPYFARMKTLNREGPPVLGDLPDPARCTLADLLDAARDDSAVVVDTRSRAAFLAGHVPGSLHAPLGVSFPLVVGAYVDPGAPIDLIVDEGALDEAVRSLVRIGYDRVAGYTAPEALAGAAGLAVTPRLEMASVQLERDVPGATLLDVRGAAEFASGSLPGALNVAHTRLAPRLDEVPRDREVAVYCRSGNRAASAASYLEREGYRATVIDGLLSDWRVDAVDEQEPDTVEAGT